MPQRDRFDIDTEHAHQQALLVKAKAGLTNMASLVLFVGTAFGVVKFW